jgi:SOS-response transcriptional repressor LexA
VLEFIRAFRRIRGFAPTLQELATDMGLRSRSNMHRIVKELVSKGLLSKKPLLARTLKDSMSDLLTKDEIKQYMLLLDNLPEDSPQVDKVWALLKNHKRALCRESFMPFVKEMWPSLYWGQAPQNHGGCL